MPKLSELDAAASGIISGIDAEEPYRDRLQGMGIGPGKSLTVIRRGTPMIVDVCGGRLAIDPHLARSIKIEMVDPSAAIHPARTAS